MRVVQLNSFSCFSTGGIMKGIHRQLLEAGHDSFIGYGRGPVLDDPFSFRVNSKYGVYADALLSRLDDRSGFHSKKATKELIRRLEGINPDVVHFHEIHGYYLNVVELFDYLRKSRVKVVWTLHDCWAFTGHCGFFTFAQCEKWMSCCGSCPNKHEYPRSVLLDNSQKNFLEKKQAFSSLDSENVQLVAPSKWLAGLAERSFLGKYNISVVPNGINEKVFYPRQSDILERHGIAGKKVILGVASTWETRKGLRDLVWLNDYLDESYKIVIVGLSGKQIKRLPDGILGLPRTKTAEELACWYSAAHILANPTYEDNYPTVNLEAQACGTPVVTYETGGSPETLLRGSVAVPYGDRQAFLSSVVFHDGVLLEEGDFSEQKRLSGYLPVYESILGR